MLLSNADFLKQLQDLFDARKSSGSVFLTEKRFTYEPAASSTAGDVEMGEASGSGSVVEEGEEAAVEAEEEHKEYPCLFRATDGKGKQPKVKISTLILPSDYETFSLAYGALLKSSLSTLRKKKKIKRKAAPSGAAGGGSTFAVQLTKVVGPRRGAGVDKRRRLLKRREKEVKKLVARKKRDAER